MQGLVEVVAYAIEQPMHRFSMQAAGSKPLNGYSFELKGATPVQKNASADMAHRYIEDEFGVQAEGSTQASKQRARLRRMSTELLKIF